MFFAGLVLKGYQVLKAEETKIEIKKSVEGKKRDTVAKAHRPNSREARCRRILEKIFGMPFPCTRPSWLRNPLTNKCLELDCYNVDLKLALEYQGIQHYKFTKRFQGSVKDLEDLKLRDHHKRAICIERGVQLIEVPYYIREENLEDYIMKAIAKMV